MCYHIKTVFRVPLSFPPPPKIPSLMRLSVTVSYCFLFSALCVKISPPVLMSLIRLRTYSLRILLPTYNSWNKIHEALRQTLLNLPYDRRRLFKYVRNWRRLVTERVHYKNRTFQNAKLSTCGLIRMERTEYRMECTEYLLVLC